MNKYPEPWIEYSEIWPTKASFFVFLRGAIRRAMWEKNPIKITFKNKNCSPVPEEIQTKAKFGAYCALSGVWEGKSKLQVDHKIGNMPLREWEDVLPFILHMFPSEDQMQLVTKEAHKIKSHSERYDLSYEEATFEKEIIKFKKCSSEEQKSFLLSVLGESEMAEVTNATKRVEAFREYLKGEKK